VNLKNIIKFKIRKKIVYYIIKAGSNAEKVLRTMVGFTLKI